VGVSFYTFQSISYVIDVYRGQQKACGDYFTFIAFVSFFPQLVAGPIERARHMLPQFERMRHFDNAFAVSGMRFILYGLFKKVVIADNLAKLVDEVFNNPSVYHGPGPVIATVFFSIQIYCDFSGYSDIAVGTARLLGFDLMQNFRTPYNSTSVREFWQRWHISLSTWFRDYVYIPLGGNRVSEWRKYFNIFITFLVSGLWHGANFTFVIWGSVHGGALIVEEFTANRIRAKLPAWFKWFITNIFVCSAWVFFRAKSVHDSMLIFKNCTEHWSPDALPALFQKVYHSGLFVAVVMLLVFTFFAVERRLGTDATASIFNIRNIFIRWSIYYLLILCIIFVGLNDSSPNFIYFKF
jgi:D-alanyl-lipoteichoic acid acyltransferase DltB (MBOAT superfamily)